MFVFIKNGTFLAVFSHIFSKLLFSLWNRRHLLLSESLIHIFNSPNMYYPIKRNCILLYYLVVFHLLEKLRKFLDIFSILSRFKKWFQETFPFRGAEGPEKWKKFREITFWTKIIWNKWSNSFEISSTSVWKRSK